MKKYLTCWIIVFLCIYNHTHAQTQIPTHFQVRRALQIDGQVNFIDAGTNNRGIGNEVTLEAWVRTNQTHDQWVVGKKDAIGGFSLEIRNGRAVFEGSNAVGASSGLSQTVVTDNKWHHLAGVYAGGRWRIWVDGVFENSSSSGPITLSSNAPLVIARNPLNQARYFKGLIGEIKLWNTGRTENQIRTYMAKVVATTSPELVGYFRCDYGVFASNKPPHLTDFSNQQLHGYINASMIGYSIEAPPIGDESIFYYGFDLNAKSFNLAGDFVDTISVQKFTGNSKGFHLYKSYSSYGITGFRPMYIGYLSYYFGTLAVGDTNTTYQVKLIKDSEICNIPYLIYARKDSRSAFAKLRPGPYNYALDSTSQYTVRDRGDLGFILPRIDLPPLQVFFNGAVAKCPENRPTTLKASKGHFFKWSTGESTRSIQVNQAGKYWVKINDYCSEIGSDTFRVEIAPPLKLPALKTTDTLICDNEPLQLKMPKGYFYQWPDGSAADSFLVTKAGIYSVTTTDPRCGNSVISSINVKTVACSPEKVFIPNIITPNNDGRNDFFSPIGIASGQWDLTVFNRWGKQVYQAMQYKNNWQAEGVNSGIYYYILQHPKTGKKYKGYLEVMR